MKRPLSAYLHSSFLHKLLGIIFLLAFTVILLIYLFSNIIFFNPHRHLIFFLITVVLILFFLAGFFILQVIKPVHELERGVRELSQGNLDVVLKVTGRDEIGRISATFNQMTVQLRKMIQARDQLLLDVSHELRTPITRARIALEMMDDSPGKISVLDDLREMEIMITEILETERLRNSNNHLTLSEISVKDLVQECTSAFRIHEGNIRVHAISEAISFRVDRIKIGIVLKNLLDNALKYSAEAIKPVEVSVIDQPDQLIIQIEDFGPGIPEDKKDLLFEPFYRVDTSRSRKTGGYGLGLHLSKKIMEAHEAEIRLVNKTGKETGLIAEMIFTKQNLQTA